MDSVSGYSVSRCSVSRCSGRVTGSISRYFAEGCSVSRCSGRDTDSVSRYFAERYSVSRCPVRNVGLVSRGYFSLSCVGPRSSCSAHCKNLCSVSRCSVSSFAAILGPHRLAYGPAGKGTLADR